MSGIRKYPRTRHLEGSRLQPGDEDLEQVRFAAVRGRNVVVEEKVDGANAAVGFTPSGELWLQSRGHALSGGPRERQFALFKTWASAHQQALWEALGDRYLMYGEWLYARHTVYYDALPHYFLEFDVLDRAEGVFLSTPRRRELLARAPVVSVPVLWEGAPRRVDDLLRHVAPSLYRTAGWREALREEALARGIDPVRAAAEGDDSDLSEGLYLKLEEGGRVVERLKWVRVGFLDAVQSSGSHWHDRPILPNRLAPGVSLFG